MADRMTVIRGLCTLADKAALSGDDRLAALANDAAELLINDQNAAASLSRRRESDAERKRRQRHGTSRDNVTGQDGTGRDTLPPGFSPTPPFPNPPLSNDTPTARAREATDPRTEQTLATLTAQCPADHWPALDAFLKRRPYATWNGWLKAFLVGAAKYESWADVAQACTDDEALPRPIASPMAFRAFVDKAHQERVRPKPAPSDTAKPSAQGGARNDAAIDDWYAKRQAARTVANG